MKKFRRAAAWFLTLFMLVGDIGGMRLNAYAADDEEEVSFETEAENEGEVESPAEETEEPGDAESADPDAALIEKLDIYVNGLKIDVLKIPNGFKDETTLTGYRYEKGSLFISNLTLGDSSKNKSGLGINCKGDLNLFVLGECEVKISEVGLRENYGIKVDGNLTIQNVDTAVLMEFLPNIAKDSSRRDKALSKGGTLKVGCGENPNGGAGILCSGELRMQSLEVEVPGIGKNTKFVGLNVLSSGPKSTSSTETMSAGIRANDVVIEGADVTAKGKESAGISCGIMANNLLTVQDGEYIQGKLTAESDTCGDTRAAAVYASKGLNIGTGAKLTATATGSDAFEHFAVFSDGDINVGGALTANASGGAAGNYAVATTKGHKINLDGTGISTPKNGKVISENSTGKERITVANPDDTVASEVEIVKVTEYGVWILGKKVNSLNKDDIDGTGKISYNPTTGVLNLDNASLAPNRFVAYAISANTSLQITGKADIVIPAGGIGIKILDGHDLDLQGDFTFTGTSALVGAQTMSSNEAIRLVKADSTLTIDGADTKLTISGEFNKNVDAAVYSHSSIIINDGTIDISGANKGLYSGGFKTGEAPAKIELNGGHISISVNDPEASYSRTIAIHKSDGGDLTMSPSMMVKVPAEGADIATSDTWYRTFVGRDGKDVKHIELVSGVKPLMIDQKDGVYGQELPAYEPAEEGDELAYEGKTVKGEKYGPSATAPVLPGSYKLTVTRMKGSDYYRGSDDFVIAPKEVSVSASAVDRDYVEGDVTVALEDVVLNGIVGSDDLTIDLSGAVVAMEDANAGEEKDVTVTGIALSGETRDYYTLTDATLSLKVSIRKIDWEACDLTVDVNAGEEKNIDLSALIAPGAVLGELKTVSGNEQLASEPVLSSQTLSVRMKDSVSGTTVISISANNATNHKDYVIKVTLVTPHECVPEPVAEVPAGCETPGIAAHFECPICHKCFKDAEGKEEVSLEELSTPPAGHKWDGGTVIEEPTTEKDGKILYTCTVCHATKTDKIPKGTSLHSALDPVPENLDNATVLNLVKGQKFTLSANWVIVDKKANGKFISISKKGAVKAKKETQQPVTISHNSGRMIRINVFKPVMIDKSLTLDAVTDAAGRQISLKDYGTLKVYWYSANPDVATVDQSGFVKPVAKGKAKITAYINGTAYNCSVTVKEKAGIAATRTLHLATGAKKNVSIKGMKAWDGGTPGIASAKKKTIIAGENAGTAVFTTSANGVTYTLNVRVDNIGFKIAEGSGLSPAGKNKYNLTITAGQTADLSFLDADQPLVFKSSKPETVFCDENGKVSARAAGKGKITAKIDNKTVTVNVTVKAP